MNYTEQPTATTLFQRNLERNRKHAALVAKRKRLYNKAIRMHPATARVLFAQLDELDGKIDANLKG